MNAVLKILIIILLNLFIYITSSSQQKYSNSLLHIDIKKSLKSRDYSIDKVSYRKKFYAQRILFNKIFIENRIKKRRLRNKIKREKRCKYLSYKHIIQLNSSENKPLIKKKRKLFVFKGKL